MSRSERRRIIKRDPHLRIAPFNVVLHASEELALGTLKALLRQASAGTPDALEAAIAVAPEAITLDDTAYFAHCGFPAFRHPAGAQLTRNVIRVTLECEITGTTDPLQQGRDAEQAVRPKCPPSSFPSPSPQRPHRRIVSGTTPPDQYVKVRLVRTISLSPSIPCASTLIGALTMNVWNGRAAVLPDATIGNVEDRSGNDLDGWLPSA